MNKYLSLSTMLQKAGSLFFSLGMITGLATVTIGLISCGGGGGGDAGTSSGTVSGAMTVSSLNPPGIVASSVYQTIVISGSNFANGTTVSILGSSGTPVVSSVAVTNSNTLTAVIQIASAPTGRYVTLSVKPASAAAVTQVLGVAAVPKTYANILASTYFPTCTGCHTGTANGGLDLTTANNLNNEPSQGCTARFRVKRGDPRRSSSFLIDKIQATSAVGNSPCSGDPMPKAGPLMAAEIQEIVEWVAGGAH